MNIDQIKLEQRCDATAAVIVEYIRRIDAAREALRHGRTADDPPGEEIEKWIRSIPLPPTPFDEVAAVGHIKQMLYEHIVQDHFMQDRPAQK